MNSAFLLAWRYLMHNKLRTVILVLCITITMALPMAVHLLVRHYDQKMTARAEATPMLVGAKGNRYDLVLGALYFRARHMAPVPYGEVSKIKASGLALGIPIHVQFTAGGYPLVGTTLDYFDFRKLRLREGRLPQVLGDAVLGSHVALDLGLKPGDKLVTDQQDLYNIAATYPMKLKVVGVFDDQQTPDDNGVFVDVRTAWIVAGIGHGHANLESSGNASNGVVTANASLFTYVEVTPENLSSFHFHGDEAAFPISAIVVLPFDARSATILKGRYSVSDSAQLVVPTEVIKELMSIVLQIRKFLDANFLLVGVSTMLFLVLVVWLSLQVRKREMDTLHRIGCSRWTVLQLQVGELVILFAVSFALCAVLIAAIMQYGPDLLALH